MKPSKKYSAAWNERVINVIANHSIEESTLNVLFSFQKTKKDGWGRQDSDPQTSGKPLYTLRLG